MASEKRKEYLLTFKGFCLDLSHVKSSALYVRVMLGRRVITSFHDKGPSRSGMRSIWNLWKINFFGNLAGIFSLVRGRLCVRTASFRIFSLVLRCVESYPRCFITLPALRSIYLPLLQDRLSNGSKRHYQSGKLSLFEQRLASFAFSEGFFWRIGWIAAQSQKVYFLENKRS